MVETEEKVCKNCHYMQPPFSRSSNDTNYCRKKTKYVGPINSHSCELWKKREPPDPLA
jgi:hypothetical protein